MLVFRLHALLLNSSDPGCMSSLTHLLLLSPSPSQYVLAVGSSVFCAMFYGDLAEEESEIHIPDVEPAAFLILLK